MKRRWMIFLVSAIAAVNLFLASNAHAENFSFSAVPQLLLADATPASSDFITQLETEILPKLESILSPEQQTQFQTAIAEGNSFRKAFKSLTLSPTQKSKIKSLLKTLPSTAAFATLTPEQKKQLFLKKKEFFIPTPQEITDKISAGMKLKGGSLPAGVSEKITDKLEAKEKMIFTPESSE